MPKALIIWGGWDGHEPEQVANLFAEVLHAESFDVEISRTLDSLLDGPKLAALDLFIPVWTMGKISAPQENAICHAVTQGLGIAGCHGGMCDAFREAAQWQFMTGGQWVAHPGNDGVQYTVKMEPTPDPITVGLADFEVATEQYYLHVDPAIRVLATTRFPVAAGPHEPNGPVEMPVVWTKRYGLGKVFYNSLGHHADVLRHPTARELMRRGFRWARR